MQKERETDRQIDRETKTERREERTSFLLVSTVRDRELNIEFRERVCVRREEKESA
jgi:hypothetical protein